MYKKETHCPDCHQRYIVGELHDCPAVPKEEPKPSTILLREKVWIENRIVEVTEYIMDCVRIGAYSEADEALSELNRRFAQRNQL
jgi:hypothetical protein